MEMGSYSVLILVIIFALISAEEGKVIQDRKDIIDGLLENLHNEQWTAGEETCLGATIALLNGVKNQTLWATWIWNSMQVPTGTFYGSKYHYGNFDQCLQVPWSSSHPSLRTQYCLVDVKLTKLRKYAGELPDPYASAESYLGMETRLGRVSNTLTFGVCLPADCQPESVAKISRYIYQLSLLPLEEVHVDPRDCQVAGQSSEKTAEFYILLYLVLFMTFICLVVYFTRNNLDSDSTVSKILHCFCPTRNFNALTEISKNEVKSIHGMRAITCGALIVMHFIVYTHFSVINYGDAEKALNTSFGSHLVHLDACVDTFFVMSGLLHLRGLLSSKSSKPLKVITKRYFRLLAPFALTVVAFGHVMPHVGSGPIWPRQGRQFYEPCANKWWRNLLMMGNRPENGEICILVTWYIHCDYQLTILGTMIFMLYQSSRKRGFLVYWGAFILSFVIPTFLTYRDAIPGVVYYDLSEAHDMNRNRVYGLTYVSSYTRASSYLIGMAMGYLMTVYKPQNYRKTISKISSILWFCVGFSLMLLVLHIGANSFHKRYSALIGSIYAAVDRSIWAIGICIIIAVCEYGTLPIINDFLSSKVFVPLSKLSYLIYMSHTLFLNRDLFSLRAPLSYDFYNLITVGMGYVVIANCFSYLCWFVIEAPMTNLINVIFDNRKTKPLENGEVMSNGVKND